MKIIKDDLVVFSNSVETATAQISALEAQDAKAGLQISYGKTEFLTNIETAPNTLEVGQKQSKGPTNLNTWVNG